MSSEILPCIESAEQMRDTVCRVGILPFFRCGIEGYSLEEATPRERWFTSLEGPWDWKCRTGELGIVYGKFLRNKAVFMTPEWYAVFLNARRDGLDFETLYEDGLATRTEKAILDALRERGELRTDELKRLTQAGKSFDRDVTHLEMMGYLIVTGFRQRLDRFMRPYGWHISLFALPEQALGIDPDAFEEEPEESRERLIARILENCPNAVREDAEALIDMQ